MRKEKWTSKDVMEHAENLTSPFEGMEQHQGILGKGGTREELARQLVDIARRGKGTGGGLTEPAEEGE